jgi:hypothetical protein
MEFGGGGEHWGSRGEEEKEREKRKGGKEYNKLEWMSRSMRAVGRGR